VTVALTISILALFVSIWAVWYTRLAVKEARRQADAAQAEVHLAYG